MLLCFYVCIMGWVNFAGVLFLFLFAALLMLSWVALPLLFFDTLVHWMSSICTLLCTLACVHFCFLMPCYSWLILLIMLEHLFMLLRYLIIIWTDWTMKNNVNEQCIFTEFIKKNYSNLEIKRMERVPFLSVLAIGFLSLNCNFNFLCDELCCASTCIVTLNVTFHMSAWLTFYLCECWVYRLCWCTVWMTTFMFWCVMYVWLYIENSSLLLLYLLICIFLHLYFHHLIDTFCLILHLYKSLSLLIPLCLFHSSHLDWEGTGYFFGLLPVTAQLMRGVLFIIKQPLNSSLIIRRPGKIVPNWNWFL